MLDTEGPISSGCLPRLGLELCQFYWVQTWDRKINSTIEANVRWQRINGIVDCVHAVHDAP
ncbi:hypothetical protein J6590_060320 [Homalodisca vitripennis]|nr:hypothetical protein J6590_060320 [Homalodisca vitripennis]